MKKQATPTYLFVLKLFGKRLSKNDMALTTPLIKEGDLTPWHKFISRFKIILLIFEKLFLVSAVLFAILVDAKILFLVLGLGAIIFFRFRLRFAWWYLKVFVLFRSTFEHRRQLYLQGTLPAHFSIKKPKRYKSPMGHFWIWAQSKNSHDRLYIKMREKYKKAKRKEIIKL